MGEKVRWWNGYKRMREEGRWYWNGYKMMREKGKWWNGYKRSREENVLR